ALMEIELPASRLLPALFGFNAGVELGQLVIVALAWPLLSATARYSTDAHRRLAEAGSAAILALGVFWIVTRAFG
ncbi:MAG: HupE/UreJ family protein, partial [Candidatus Binatia bacterium]